VIYLRSLAGAGAFHARLDPVAARRDLAAHAVPNRNARDLCAARPPEEVVPLSEGEFRRDG